MTAEHFDVTPVAQTRVAPAIIEALRFYANRDHYEPNFDYVFNGEDEVKIGEPSDIEDDRGERARQALASLEVEV